MMKYLFDLYMQNLDRFKMRWFDKTKKTMMEVINLNIKDNYALVRYIFADEYTPDEEVNISDGNLLQCTGLKDKNGNLIYEGDIILEKIVYEDENYKEVTEYDKHIIVYQDCAFQLALNCDYNNLELAFPMGESKASDFEEFEIIGNIYTHPELCNN